MRELKVLNNEFQPDGNAHFDFHRYLKKYEIDLKPVSIETLQVNITKLCNQACQHCHVDASPKRTEEIDKRTVDRCLEILSENEAIQNLDITGGAPELNPHFDYFVVEAKKLNKHVMVRHNLTVTFDGHPNTGESKRYLPEFFAENNLEVISSLPYYQEFFTDKQRGRGVFNKSIESIRLLNEQGYGQEGSGLELNLVYNPVGTYLPPPQENLEKEYKKELKDKFGLVFNKLFTITNMPIHRFKEFLLRSGTFDEYMEKLMNAFNPAAAEGVMCRSMLSVSYDGKIYDCDFNQMIDMQIKNGKPLTVFDFDYDALVNRRILFNSHCFGCTAGGGSSCGGSTA